jgi:hypothetical protein
VKEDKTSETRTVVSVSCNDAHNLAVLMKRSPSADGFPLRDGVRLDRQEARGLLARWLSHVDKHGSSEGRCACGGGRWLRLSFPYCSL